MFEELFPIDWSAFHFLRPGYLWLLVPALIVFILGLVSVHQDVRWKTVIAPHLRNYVIRRGSERIKTWMHIAGFMAMLAGIIALAGPTWKKRTLPGQTLETPMVILLDLSQSMMATDLQPNRLERAKFKLNDLFDFNPRARLALIGYAGTAHLIVPLTKDYDIVRSHLDGLSPNVMPFAGSDLNNALSLAATVMSVTDAPGHILLVTDDISDETFGIIRTYTQGADFNFMLMPTITEGGAEVPGRNGSTVRDAEGNVVFTSLNRSVLSQIGSLEGVTISQLTLDDSDMEGISKQVSDNLKFTEAPEEEEDDWRDAGLLLVVPMALLFLLIFRKGWVLYGVVLLSITSCSSDGSTFRDLWFTPDYQGQRLLDKGDFMAAAEAYDDPMRKGVAYFKAGDYEDAIKQFDRDTSANGAYNLGLAYLSNGDTLSALLAMNIAVARDPELRQAKAAQQQLGQMKGGRDEVNPDDAQEASDAQPQNNIENKDMEDLGGGGQEATEEDMKKQRKEETVATDIRKGKELDEVPDDIGTSTQPDNSKVLMRKVDDDPSLFLKRKFEYQVKQKKMKPAADAKKW